MARPKREVNESKAIEGLTQHVMLLTEVVKDLFQTPESVTYPDGGAQFRESAFMAQYRYHASRLFPKKVDAPVGMEQRLVSLEANVNYIVKALTVTTTDPPENTQEATPYPVEDPELDKIAAEMADAV